MYIDVYLCLFGLIKKIYSSVLTAQISYLNTYTKHLIANFHYSRYFLIQCLEYNPMNIIVLCIATLSLTLLYLILLDILH